MKPRIVVVSDRSLTEGERRTRESARLLAVLAERYRIDVVTRVAATEAEGPVALGNDFIEHRIRRTGAETDWQAIAAARWGAVGGDDRFVFDRVRALNPAFMSTLHALLTDASAAICVRPYAFDVVRTLWAGPLVYDALALEYPIQARRPSPNSVELLEGLAALEERCAHGAAAVLCGSERTASLCADLYDLPRERIVVVNPAFDPSTSGPATRAEREHKRSLTNLRDRPFALFIGDRGPANVQDVVTLCAIAARVPGLLFLVAGNVAHDLPPLNRPPNVQFTGEVDDATAAVLLETAEAFVMAGSTRPTPARKLLAAIAHGAPIVATPEACAQLLTDGLDGDIVPASMIPERLQRLMLAPQIGTAHALRARETAQRACDPAHAAKPLFATLAALMSPEVPA